MYTSQLGKYYWIQWLPEEKIFLKKPPLLTVNFKMFPTVPPAGQNHQQKYSESIIQMHAEYEASNK